MSFLIALSVVSASVAAPIDDHRAADAVEVFSRLCVGLFVGEASDLDATKFKSTKLRPDTVARIKPNLVEQDVWDVTGKSSNVRMLVHYDPAGMCVVEVAAADETSLRKTYEEMIEKISRNFDKPPKVEPDQTKEIGDNKATTSIWEFVGSSQNILFAITTYPEPKFMIQHVMTINYTD